MCLKLTARATEQRRLHRSGVLIVKFATISHIHLVFPSLL